MIMKKWSGIRAALVCVILAGTILFAACGGREEELTELEFTVVEKERLPEELFKIIEEKKAESFKLTYADGGYLYLCVGYGKQQTGGYSISVNKLGATENAIYLDTNLIGPTEADEKNASPSYPYLVVKTPFMDKTVVFE